MYNPNSGFPMRNRGMFGASGYRYQTLPYPQEGVQAGSLISKVMGLLATSFLFAFIGTIIGMFVIPLNYGGSYWVVAIGGFVVLILLNFNINTRGLNLFLLFLFTLLEGLALAPLLNLYMQTANGGLILAEAFLLTAITSLSLSVYAWITKRNFNRLGGILFMGVILLIVAMLIGIFFQSTIFALVISVLGVGIFSAYVLYYVQQAKYLADTMPNAIGLTVSLFITLLNLFLFILRILSIVQGGGGGRRN
ncbi:MAG: Bax inhibitor-1/YccA family protein [Ktedonobacteraceae bacterium]